MYIYLFLFSFEMEIGLRISHKSAFYTQYLLVFISIRNIRIVFWTFSPMSDSELLGTENTNLCTKNV